MEVRKDWSALAVLAGKICELQDEPDQALDFYMRAIYRMGERDSDVIRRTVQLLVPRRAHRRSQAVVRLPRETEESAPGRDEPGVRLW